MRAPQPKVLDEPCFTDTRLAAHENELSATMLARKPRIGELRPFARTPDKGKSTDDVSGWTAGERWCGGQQRFVRATRGF